jgi:Sec-independent protein translocase protein TatA
MDFLGIGPLEILFIIIIALIIFGPKDIVKASQTMGQFLRKLVTSSGWKAVQQTSRDLRNIPNKLIREAGLEEIQDEVNEIGKIAKPPDFKKEIEEELQKVEEGLSAWTESAKLDFPEKIDNKTVEPTPGAGEPVEQGETSGEAED